MSWIVLAIVLFVGLYTWVNLRYRKVVPAFEPYAEALARQKAANAGYTRITVGIRLLADPAAIAGGAQIAASAGGIPADLEPAITGAPLLPEAVDSVTSPAVLDHMSTYVIQFHCTVGDDRQQIAGAEAYVKSGVIVIVPVCEKLTGLVARSRGSAVRLNVPPDKLEPGNYQVRLLAERGSRAWALQVH